MRGQGAREAACRLRRVVFSFLTVVMALALIAPGASAVRTKRCGTRYTPPCERAAIHVRPSPSCQLPGSYTLLPIRVHSNAGIRRVKIKLDGRTIKVYRYKGRGPTHKKFRHLTIRSRHLKFGTHTVTVVVTDVRGRKSSRRFSIVTCKKPRKPRGFTG